MDKLEPVLQAALEKSAREVPCCEEKEARIAELEAVINRAGALACQGASTELIRQVLAESKLDRAALDKREWEK